MLFGSLFNVPNSSVLTIDDDKVRRYPEDMKKLGLSVSYQPGGKQGLTVHEAVDCFDWRASLLVDAALDKTRFQSCVIY